MQSELLTYIKKLREEIIAAFESFEEAAKFERTSWDYKNGSGGGEMAVIRGSVFEKAAVNFSHVSGDQFPGSDAKGPFSACGVSLITHMQNPKAPTVHMNVRYIETPNECWLGGGYDLTPMGYDFKEDTEHFHGIAKEALSPYGRYEEFAENAREYFYISHRKKERGVGGIFFDHLPTSEVPLWKSVGDSFLPAILPIYERRVGEEYTDGDKALQNQLRGHYAEFNLHYDRGTKFGFLSGGNPEAILCSMPPVATW